MDPEINSSIQDPSIFSYLEPSVKETQAESPSCSSNVDRSPETQESSRAVIDDQTNQAAKNRFNTYPDRSHFSISLREHYQFKDWTDVISSSLTGLYAKVIRMEYRFTIREIEVERENKRLIEYRERLQLNFRTFLLQLKENQIF